MVIVMAARDARSHRQFARLLRRNAPMVQESGCVLPTRAAVSPLVKAASESLHRHRGCGVHFLDQAALALSEHACRGSLVLIGFKVDSGCVDGNGAARQGFLMMAPATCRVGSWLHEQRALPAGDLF